jgi:cilia- and flagella-associated protein 300
MADDVIEGVTVGDELRALCVDPDSEHADLFSPAERSELLFRLLRWVAVGGSMCQWEDDVGPYLAAVREVYRDLVTVGKGAGGAIEVQSVAVAVEGLAGEGVGPLFPHDNPHSVCWVIVTGVGKRTGHVTIVYHAWVPYW